MEREARREGSPDAAASPEPDQVERAGLLGPARLPGVPELQHTDPTDILASAHYEFRAVLEPTGECDYEYICRHPAVAPRTRSGTDTLSLGDDQASRSAKCGPFWLNLYVWDRTDDYLQRTGISLNELDAHCGVSLFRDGLRVLPYREPGDGWLLLD